MRYDGGARVVRADGSIELGASPRVGAAAVAGLLFASVGLAQLVARIGDLLPRRGERRIPFTEIASLTIEQREPRKIALAPPVLAVNGEELMSIQSTFANADLERELQVLVGLPPRASPRDFDGIGL